MLPLFCLISALTVLLPAGPSAAKPPPHPDPSLRLWFESLQDPETTLSCCEEADCREVDARIARDHHEVQIDGIWVEIPERKIIRPDSNPTGRAVLCWSPTLGIMCFVPGPGV